MSNDTHCAKEDLGSDKKLEYPESSESSEYSDESDETESMQSYENRHKIRKRQIEEAPKRRWRRGGWWHAGTASSSTAVSNPF